MLFITTILRHAGDQTKAPSGIRYDQTLPARPETSILPFPTYARKGRAGIPMTHFRLTVPSIDVH